MADSYWGQVYRSATTKTARASACTSWRLNYFNAMAHFFFGIPRLILVLAPFTYLFLGAHPMKADALAVIAYILPHIGLSLIAKGRSARDTIKEMVGATPFSAFRQLAAVDREGRTADAPDLDQIGTSAAEQVVAQPLDRDPDQQRDARQNLIEHQTAMLADHDVAHSDDDDAAG